MMKRLEALYENLQKVQTTHGNNEMSDTCDVELAHVLWYELKEAELIYSNAVSSILGVTPCTGHDTIMERARLEPATVWEVLCAKMPRRELYEDASSIEDDIKSMSLT